MTEQTQAFDVTPYLTGRQGASHEEIQKLEEQLEELVHRGFNLEALPKKLLAMQKAACTYQRISPEFLRMSGEKRWTPGGWARDIHVIFVPRFGVYSLDNTKMTLQCGYGSPDFYFGVKEPRLPEVFIKQLAMVTEIFKDGQTGSLLRFSDNSLGYNRDYNTWLPVVDDSLPRKIRNKQIRDFNEFKENLAGRYDRDIVTLSSTFNGLFPRETRERIIKAKPLFGNDLFIVAETKPEEWTIGRYVPPRLVEEPLVIGVIDDKCFLVDQFDTTPLEDYVRREFTT